MRNKAGLAAALLGMATARAGVLPEAMQAPFAIPPDGQPEALTGGVAIEAPTAMAFDTANRPYLFNACEPASFGSILTLREGRWVRLSYMDALRKAYPELQVPRERYLHALGTLAIDDDHALYAVIRVAKSRRNTGWTLLYSPDLGGHFEVHDLPGMGFLEIRTGPGQAGGPPAVGCLELRQRHPAEWTDYYNLAVFLPVKQDRRLVLGNPVLVSTNCFGISNHSGGYSFAATIGDRTHLVYADIPGKEADGNPTYAATIDRNERRVTARTFLVAAPPRVPDVHATPVIAADTERRLHVLAGAHGQPFHSLRSMAEDRVDGGWTEPRPVGGQQTYATLVCDASNRLHSVYRVHPRLLYRHKDAGADTWSEPVELVRAPAGHRGYTIFYHRLFIDRRGALFLSFTFYEMKTAEKGRYPRALAVSEDGGQTWRLATTETFRRRLSSPGMTEKPE